MVGILYLRSKKAFTLMEIMVVIFLLSIIAAFTMPNFAKARRKAHEKEAINQALIFHAANLSFYANNDAFWDTGAGPENNLAIINQTMGIQLITTGHTFEYRSPAAPDQYYFRVTTKEPDGSDDFIIHIDEGPIAMGTNPCCLNPPGAACPSLLDC